MINQNLVLAVFFFVFGGFALAGEGADSQKHFDINPGQAGPNFLRPFQMVDPETGSQFTLNVGSAVQWDRGTDVSVTPTLRVEMPFNSAVKIWIDATAIEWFKVDPKTRDAWKTEELEGITGGPIRVGASAQIFKEEGLIPLDVAAQFEVWTTTGKGFEDRRYPDAPGYYFGAGVGKDVYSAEVLDENGEPHMDPGAIVQKVRIFGNMGFVAWQQGVAKQNDATAYGARVQTDFKHDIRIDTGVSGYIGYQENDRPVIVDLVTTYRGFKYIDLYVGGAHSFTEPGPDWEAKVGLVYKTNFEGFPKLFGW